jgi:hypothetical protein
MNNANQAIKSWKSSNLIQCCARIPCQSKRELFGCYWKNYISFAVVGVSPTTLVACEDTSDGKRKVPI